MARKGRKSRKKSVVKKPTRAIYEATITELNQKLSQLRTEFQRIDDVNFKLKDQLQCVEGDHTEVAGHLGRVLEDKNQRIDEVEDSLIESEKLRIEEENGSAERIKELEQNYKSTLTQLTTESQLLAFILSSLDEFRLEREETLEQFENLVVTSEKQDVVFKEQCYDLQQKTVVEIGTLKSEMGTNLKQVTTDFIRSSQIRTAAYARRLIRENIDLQQELDKKLKTVLRLNDKFNKLDKRNRIRTEDFDALNQLIVHQEHLIEFKKEIVKKITKKYDDLLTTYVEHCKYKLIYDSIGPNRCLQTYDWEKIAMLTENLENEALVHQTILEKTFADHHAHETEILALKKTIEHIKAAIELAIDSFRRFPKYQIQPSPSADMIGIAREKLDALLEELVMILSTHTDSIPKSVSAFDSEKPEPLYAPGNVGLIPKISPVPIAPKSGDKITSEDVPPLDTLHLPTHNLMSILNEQYPFINIELGSDLYASSPIEQSIDDVVSNRESSNIKTVLEPAIFDVTSSCKSTDAVGKTTKTNM